MACATARAFRVQLPGLAGCVAGQQRASPAGSPLAAGSSGPGKTHHCHRSTILYAPQIRPGNACRFLRPFRSSLAGASTQLLLQSLKPSPRMPVLFVGHGSPMNAIEVRRVGAGVGQAMGKELLVRQAAPATDRLPFRPTGRPRAGRSRPWRSRKRSMISSGFPAGAAGCAVPRTRCAGGWPALWHKRSRCPRVTNWHWTLDHWGLGHGAWSVLKPMFPKADIPVLQLSMDYSRPPAEHFALGRQLHVLRSRGVFVVGSGNIVRETCVPRGTAAARTKPTDWAPRIRHSGPGPRSKRASSTSCTNSSRWVRSRSRRTLA